MLVTCRECEKSISDQASSCPNCGCPVKTTEPDASELKSSDPFTKHLSVPWSIGLPVLVGGILIFCLNYHVVWIQNMPTPIRRTSMSLSEPMSNLDEIAGTPWITAVGRFPLTVKALQQAGVLESDAAREERVKKEINAKIEASQQEFQAKMDAQAQELRDKWGY